jgi:hypothetical protein
MITVITGASGTISESFRKYVSNLLGNYIKGLGETATLGTAYLLTKVLMQKYKTLIMGNNITCAI